MTDNSVVCVQCGRLIHSRCAGVRRVKDNSVLCVQCGR